MSWGYKITIGMVFFMGFISVMVYHMISTKVDLVSDKYYEKGIHFQDEIDHRKNGKMIDSLIALNLNKGKGVMFSYPDSLIRNSSGTIYCYRASESKDDFDIKFSNSLPDISFILKPRGFWRVIIDYSRNGKGYIIEKELFID